MVLPSFFMLKSGGRYLSVTENSPANLPSGFLKFDEEQMWSPRVKFAAEPAETGDGRLLFHIRSLYNNKYLVTKQIDESNSWIVASAKKPEEDKSQASSCTLFEPHSLADDQSVCLRHVGTGISATHSLSPDDDTHQGVLLSSIGSSFILTDSNSVVVLPTSQIAFRSEDLNGDYLCSITNYSDKLTYQQFQSGLDTQLMEVVKEIYPTADGNYRIMDRFTGSVWSRRDNWITLLEMDDRSKDTFFSFVKIEDNVFGLRNLGNYAFCGAYTEGQSINCLSARYPTLSKQTRLILEDPVVERKIFDVKYRLSDSRIYDKKIQEIAHQSVTNDSRVDHKVAILQFFTTESKTTSWNNSCVPLKFGGKLSFEVDLVPFVVVGIIELALEEGQTHEWGRSVTTERKIETSYTVQLPPSTTVKVTMFATRGVYEVPFSYTQSDLFPTYFDKEYEKVETKKDDGLFTGISSYDIYFTEDTK